jgi:hypothetical protein
MDNASQPKLRDTVILFASIFLFGVVIGLIMTLRGRDRTQTVETARHIDNSRPEDRRRVSTNVVFGNIVIGSNNAPDALMTFGVEDEGDNA